MPETTRSRGAIKVGTVVSDRMQKSVVVRVDRMVLHGMYKRYVRRSANFMAHDEKDACKVGDVVEIVETRPLSARKRWRIHRVLRSGAAHLEATDTPEGA